MTDAGPAFTLRAATTHDAEVLLEWRNDPTTRAMSQNSTPVAHATHMAWFQAALANDKRRIMIAEDQDGPVGMVRIDIAPDGTQAEVSINIAPDARNKKLAAPLLLLAHADMATVAPDVKLLTARIKTDNPRSQRAFERAGYVWARQDNGYNFYEMPL